MHQDHSAEALSLTADLVARCARHVGDPGPRPGQAYLTEDDYEDAAKEIAQKFGGQPIWVFAYGSLLWKPSFIAAESRIGILQGWRRSFCLEIRRWRGSPERPGLMLGLKRGGSCQGLILRTAEEDKVALLSRLLKRETSGPIGLQSLQIAPIVTADGPVLALIFWAEPENGGQFVEHDADSTASILATACGHIGSCAEYLLKTVEALQAHGIRDAYMWDMQRRVAQVMTM